MLTQGNTKKQSDMPKDTKGLRDCYGLLKVNQIAFDCGRKTSDISLSLYRVQWNLYNIRSCIGKCFQATTVHKVKSQLSHTVHKIKYNSLMIADVARQCTKTG